MTNPYCASRLTREYNKINDAKNGSCIVTNFATDKYIFSDGKYNKIILTVTSYLSTLQPVLVSVRLRFFHLNLDSTPILFQPLHSFHLYPVFTPQLFNLTLISPLTFISPHPHRYKKPMYDVFTIKWFYAKIWTKTALGRKTPKMDATVNKIYLVLIIKFLFDKNL